MFQLVWFFEEKILKKWFFKELFTSTGFSKKAAASKPAKNPLGMIMDVAKQKKAQLVKQEKEMRTTMVVSKAKSEFKSFAEGKLCI